jgi:hypothetical protein
LCHAEAPPEKIAARLRDQSFLPRLGSARSHTEIDVSINPTLFPRLCPALIEGNSIHSCIPSCIEEESPILSVVIGFAIHELLFMTV